MKKSIAIIVSVIMAVCMLAGCGEKAEAPQISDDGKPKESVTVRLGGLKGPTSIGMVKLLSDAENGETVDKYEFTMAGSADELTPKLLKGELDILAVPVNLGSVLYNKSEGQIRLLAVNTLGVLYIVEKGGDTVNTIEDLKGKTIYATGKGSTPEMTLAYLLSQAGLAIGTDVTVEWMSEPSEVVAKMASQTSSIAMLPQPYVTVARGQLEGLRIAVDLNEAWDALDNGCALVTAGLIVRKEFAEEHPEAVSRFLEEYAGSTAYVNENVKDAAALVEKYDIVKAAVAEKAIPYCNIVCVSGEEMKSMAGGFLKILYDQNPQSVGGNLPAEDFYLIDD